MGTRDTQHVCMKAGRTRSNREPKPYEWLGDQSSWLSQRAAKKKLGGSTALRSTRKSEDSYCRIDERRCDIEEKRRLELKGGETKMAKEKREKNS